MAPKVTDPFKVFAFQVDVARQIERPECLAEALRRMSSHGYNACVLYLEDAFVYPRHPGIARQNAYTPADIEFLQQICEIQQMELIPVIPALGHCSYITSKPGYEHLDEG